LKRYRVVCIQTKTPKNYTHTIYPALSTPHPTPYTYTLAPFREFRGCSADEAVEIDQPPHHTPYTLRPKPSNPKT